MIRNNPAPISPEDETRRETRLKLILLAVALVLVVGYALTITEMGEQTWNQAKILLHSDVALLSIAAGGMGVAAAGIFYLFLRARRPEPKEMNASRPLALADYRWTQRLP